MEGLGKGHHWVFVLFGASLIVLNMWISWELWTPGGFPFIMPASWLNCDLWTMGCSFFPPFLFALFDFLYLFTRVSAGKDELDYGYCILYLRNTLVL